ncbi:MAG: NnrU family protein [Ignavibacteriales bacterium]|nr:NnrU family protein [Ignavibacteriales bacterium]
MIDNSYLILTVLFVASAFIRTAYEILKDSGKVDPESKPVFAFIFTVMCILWVSWFSLCLMDPYKIDVPNFLRWSGLALFVAGMILAFGALSQLRGLENIDHLVTTGLFTKIRHPMYTGFVLWILG